MFYYNKKIIYLDYMESGNKIKNAGFLRLEESEKEYIWTMQVKGLRDTENGLFDLRDSSGRLIDKLPLRKGTGYYERRFEKGGRNQDGVLYDDIVGIRVKLNGNGEVIGKWPLSEVQKTVSVGSELNSVPDGEMVQQKEVMEERKEGVKSAAYTCTSPNKIQDLPADKPYNISALTEKEENEQRDRKVRNFLYDPEEEQSRTKQKDVQVQTREEGRIIYGRWEEEREKNSDHAEGMSQEIPKPYISPSGPLCKRRLQQDIRNKEQTAEQRPAAKTEQTETGKEETANYFEDKWEQLRHMYPEIHPFGDERVYLSIALQDFVILNGEYHKMVHNSFLLHGFYSYRHLILGRFEGRGGINYYLGVPGVFYDREKMAAEMFGFEAFEGQKTPAEQGSFGYYMKRVSL